MTICTICYEDYSDDTYIHHYYNCLEEQQIALNNIANNVNPNNNMQNDIYVEPQLTNNQKNALAFAHKKSKTYSKNTRLDAIYKFNLMGYTKEDFNRSVDYIKNDVNIIIHVNLDNVLESIINDSDGLYRNRFETGTSGGCNFDKPRRDWENSLFSKLYDNAQPYERVKYGALNVTNSINGIGTCLHYGDSYFVLKKQVKNRSTFVIGDSSNMQMHLCTFEHFNILLSLIPNNLLKDIITVALKKEKSLNNNYEYIEAQIHGPVRMNQDIEILMVNKKYKDNTNINMMLNLFKNTYGCSYQYIE